ncbi:MULTISPECIES: DUF4260 family protein [Actinoalloteichus]|uniref:DUF4260 family protein n=1 Tax=Actinoalloteichus fjordicus TaxID=1612552 RepID=A0AAC9PU41_9PSEU|nr:MULTISPECIES: DUF4260 family protein [Actinoalloteichus]APU16685.1 putative DUF4260 family protein [Actinoalloteichus fjordicus]APU22751.1 putative DUF4260 family protein [Actinoalloteichus sp. GBA129-24]
MTRAVTATPTRQPPVPFAPLGLVHRVEGGLIAATAAVFFVLAGFDWWWLPALFLVFDLSFLGYAVSNRVGAFSYNLVHNFAAPAMLVSVYGILIVNGIPAAPLIFIAGCWFFHVGADRALGYGPRPSR